MSQTKAGNRAKQKLLTPREIEVVVGCLIGDGTLSQSGKEYRLRIEHSAKHIGYVEWKYRLLQRICAAPIQYVLTHNSQRFGTVGHPQLTALRQMWYQPLKQIPPELRLTPLIVAIWFMDDGTKHRDTVDISVHNFSDESLIILRHQLKNFGVETTVNSDGKGKRLYIKKHSYPIFKKLVKPYINKCMAYKLP
ncbi:MAG: hypothetical protein Q7S64_00120 [bacterium]|nr:hypothetical protein [bacterium]